MKVRSRKSLKLANSCWSMSFVRNLKMAEGRKIDFKVLSFHEFSLQYTVFTDFEAVVIMPFRPTSPFSERFLGMVRMGI